MKNKVMNTVLILFLLTTIAFISGCIGFFGNTYDYLGSKDKITIEQIYSLIELDIQNDIGRIQFHSLPESSADYFFEANLDVYGLNGEGSVEDANDMIVDTTGDTLSISFMANSDELRRTPYKFVIDMYVQEGVTIDTIVATSVGDLQINLANTTISQLTVDGSTGDIDVALTDCTMTDLTPVIMTSTGSITVQFTDIEYQGTTTWDISTSTGSIEASISNTVEVSGTRTFNIDTSTGSVDVTLSLDADFGIQASGDTSTGSVSIYGSEADYTSENFDIASIKYIFNLATTTGDIGLS